jgi:hypothetical protein
MPPKESSIEHKIYRHRLVWWLVAALALALSLCLLKPPLASAQDLSQNFQASWAPITLDKKEIQGSEVFHITIAGQISCIEDMPVPLPISQATLTLQIVAEQAAKDTRMALNPGHTITIKPFPSKKDQTAKINESVPLQFPAQAESGDYNVILGIVEAKVKAGISVDITTYVASYLPHEQSVGMVKYIAPESAVAPPPPASPPPPSSATPPISAPAPVSTPAAPVPTPASTPPSTAPTMIPLWVWLIVIVAVATIFFNIGWFLRHRS